MRSRLCPAPWGRLRSRLPRALAPRTDHPCLGRNRSEVDSERTVYVGALLVVLPLAALLEAAQTCQPVQAFTMPDSNDCVVSLQAGVD